MCDGVIKPNNFSANENIQHLFRIRIFVTANMPHLEPD